MAVSRPLEFLLGLSHQTTVYRDASPLTVPSVSQRPILPSHLEMIVGMG